MADGGGQIPWMFLVAMLLLVLLAEGWLWWWLIRVMPRIREPRTRYDQLVYRNGALGWGGGMGGMMIAWSFWDHAVVAHASARGVLLRLTFEIVFGVPLWLWAGHIWGRAMAATLGVRDDAG